MMFESSVPKKLQKDYGNNMHLFPVAKFVYLYPQKLRLLLLLSSHVIKKNVYKNNLFCPDVYPK